MNKKQFTIIDTFDPGYEYEDYLEYCGANDIVPSDEDSNDYWDWYYQQLDFDQECFFDNLDSIFFDSPVIITGKLGLWNGSPDINPVLVNDDDLSYRNGKRICGKPALKRAIEKCISNVDYFKIEYNNGVIEVAGYHHDGTNNYEIRVLNKRGRAVADNQIYRGDRLTPKQYWFRKITAEELLDL